MVVNIQVDHKLMDSFLRDLDEKLIFFFGEEYPEKMGILNEIKNTYRLSQKTREINDRTGIICPFVPGSIDVVTLSFLYLLNTKDYGTIKSVTELGFGDGRNLLLFNKLFDIPEVYGYELNPGLYNWVYDNLQKKWQENTIVSRDTSEMVFGSPFFPRNVVLMEQDITKTDFVKSRLYYLWPNEEMLRLAVPKIGKRSLIAVYHESSQELYPVLQELGLGDSICHVGVSTLGESSYVDIFRKCADKS